MFDEPKRRPTVDDLLLDLWFDNFVGRDECNEDWEFDIDVEACSELTPAQEARLRDFLLMAMAARFDEVTAEVDDMPPLSAKSERKMAKMLANPFSYAKRREFIKHLRNYVVSAALVLAICASLLFLPSTPTWASNGQSGALDGYVSVYERGVLKPYLVERYFGDKPAEDCWQSPKVDLNERWIGGGVFDDEFNE